MIGHELHRSGSFWAFLLSIDKDLAECTRQKGCSCGGRLHCAKGLRTNNLYKLSRAPEFATSGQLL